MTSLASDTLLAYCRPGFEGDLAAELTERLSTAGRASYCRAPEGEAYLTCHLVDGDATALWRELPWRELVFARQLLLSLGQVTDLPTNDRASPIADRVAEQLTEVSDVWLEHPDTNDGKQLSRFCRRFTQPVRRALSARGVSLDTDDAPRLHLFFTDSGSVRLGVSDTANSAPWPLGIPRLRMPRQAPSRSTLKLDEAIQTFMTPGERDDWLRPGMTAVDLGAAPGGWTWQLNQRSLHVTAIDNGLIDDALLATGLVEHHRKDGFNYCPAKPVDWLVCDIVEQPGRVVALVRDWLEHGHCDAAIANLKLPMKQRQATVSQALAQLRASTSATRRRVGAKQLYHDREEVTLFVSPPL